MMRQWITEIERLSDLETIDMDFFQHKILSGGRHLWTDPNNDRTSIWVCDQGNQRELGVFRDQTLIALLVTEPFYRDPDIDQIKLSVTIPSEQRKGYLRLLIVTARNHFGPLCSDEGHTNSAIELWKALIGKPAGMQIVLWNVSTNIKLPVKGLDTNAIWNDDADDLLLIETADPQRFGFGENILSEALRYSHHRRWGYATPDESNP